MFIPQNEQGVVVRFTQETHDCGVDIVSIQQACPDVTFFYNGVLHRGEFEFRSSSFLYHKHDPMICDVIICWSHDWTECLMPVIDLSQGDWHKAGPWIPTDVERELQFFRIQQAAARQSIADLRAENAKLRSYKQGRQDRDRTRREQRVVEREIRRQSRVPHPSQAPRPTDLSAVEWIIDYFSQRQVWPGINRLQQHFGYGPRRATRTLEEAIGVYQVREDHP